MHWKKLFSIPSVILDVIILMFVGWGFFEAQDWTQLGLAALACLVLAGIEFIILIAPEEGEVEEVEEEPEHIPSDTEIIEEIERQEAEKLFGRPNGSARKGR